MSGWIKCTMFSYIKMKLFSFNDQIGMYNIHGANKKKQGIRGSIPRSQSSTRLSWVKQETYGAGQPYRNHWDRETACLIAKCVATITLFYCSPTSRNVQRVIFTTPHRAASSASPRFMQRICLTATNRIFTTFSTSPNTTYVNCTDCHLRLLFYQCW